MGGGCWFESDEFLIYCGSILLEAGHFWKGLPQGKLSFLIFLTCELEF